MVSTNDGNQEVSKDRIDRGLIEQIANDRNAQAMQTFYEQYRSRVVPFLYRLTRDNQLIEEVYNEVMLKVWNNAGQYHGGAKVSTWVFTIAYRSCLRMVKRQNSYFSFFDTLPESGVEHASPDEHEHIAQEQILQQALGTLSAKHRLVTELCYFQGYALEEIGQIVDCPTNTVKTRLHHARKKIRSFLEKHHATSDFGGWL